MNATSASPTEPLEKPAPGASILVWDAPVRVFHGLMVLCFAVAWLTAESERWRLWHVTAGYTMAGLVAFRLVWGAVGTRHARFAAFVRGPGATWRYLRSLGGSQPEHHLGHNPAGAWAILGLLALSAGVTLTGWATYNEWGSAWNEEAHEALANGLMALVGVHLAGVVLSSWLHRENLARAMVTGRKQGAAALAAGSAMRSVALLLAVAVLGFWAWQWHSAPQATAAGTALTASDGDERTQERTEGPTQSAQARGGRRDRDTD